MRIFFYLLICLAGSCIANTVFAEISQNNISLLQQKKQKEIQLSTASIQEVVANPSVNPQLKRCGLVDPPSSCVFYVMNHHDYEHTARDFFEQAVSRTMRSPKSIERANHTYAPFRIPPGYFAEIKIPSNHDFSTLKPIEEVDLRHFIEDYLKTRFSVVSDLDTVRKNWGVDGPVYVFSTQKVYDDFLNREGRHVLHLAEKDQFTRKVMIGDIKYNEEDNTYIVEMRLDDKSNRIEQTNFYLVYLSLCDNKVCDLFLEQDQRH